MTFKLPTTLFTLIFLLFLSSCVPPVYEGTTYGLSEFIADSCEIASGKEGIQGLEEEAYQTVNDPFLSAPEDHLMEGDELYITLYCPQRTGSRGGS